MRDVADRGLELAPVDPVRLPPEIRHFGQLSTQRYERAQRMDEPPCHALDLKLAGGRPRDGRGEVAAGHRVAGEAERRKSRQRLAHPGEAHEDRWLRPCDLPWPRASAP